MNSYYIGEHVSPDEIRTRRTRARIAGAATCVAMSMTLGSSSEHNSMVSVPIEAKSIFELECGDAERTALVTQHEQKAVAVRLDCVPDGKANNNGALVLHIANIDGLIPGTREADRTVLEASCRQTFDARNLHADYEGESAEWVQLIDRTSASTLDNMPFISTQPVEHYVNSAYVVGEDMLPTCELSA